VEVGNPASPHGQTRLRLDGDGDFVARSVFADAGQVAPVHALDMDDVKWGSDEKLQVVRGRVEAPRAVELLAQAVGFPWDRPFPSRPGIPDEAIVVLRFGPKGGPQSAVKLWLREAEADPVVGPVLKELRRYLEDFSSGQLYL
jgi:hypothetical protein